MKRKSGLRVFGIVITFIVLLYIAFRVFISSITGEPFSFGFWSSDDTQTVQNFVVAGVDEEGVRTDLILLCHYNFSDDSMDILQIPRDTKIDNQRADKKINSAYGSSGKTETMFDEIEWLTGIRPERYVIISFDAFRELVDAIGGVELNVPIRMDYDDPYQDLVIDLYPGVQTLDGEKAEMFMRFRKNNDGTGYPNGDIDRIEAQKTFYAAVLDQTLSLGNIFNLPSIISAVTENVETDFEFGEMAKFIGRAPSLSAEDVRFHTLPGYGGYASNGVSYFFHNAAETASIIDAYFRE